MTLFDALNMVCNDKAKADVELIRKDVNIRFETDEPCLVTVFGEGPWKDMAKNCEINGYSINDLLDKEISEAYWTLTFSLKCNAEDVPQK